MKIKEDITIKIWTDNISIINGTNPDDIKTQTYNGSVTEGNPIPITIEFNAITLTGTIEVNDADITKPKITITQISSEKDDAQVFGTPIKITPDALINTTPTTDTTGFKLQDVISKYEIRSNADLNPAILVYQNSATIHQNQEIIEHNKTISYMCYGVGGLLVVGIMIVLFFKNPSNKTSVGQIWDESTMPQEKILTQKDLLQN